MGSTRTPNFARWLSTRTPRRREVEVLGDPAAREFLTLVESNDTVRADAFRQLYERGGKDALLDSLHDLEADPIVRGWLVEYLKMELG